jgi:hypothetical protein
MLWYSRFKCSSMASWLCGLTTRMTVDTLGLPDAQGFIQVGNVTLPYLAEASLASAEIRPRCLLHLPVMRLGNDDTCGQAMCLGWSNLHVQLISNSTAFVPISANGHCDTLISYAGPDAFIWVSTRKQDFGACEFVLLCRRSMSICFFLSHPFASPEVCSLGSTVSLSSRQIGYM